MKSRLFTALLALLVAGTFPSAVLARPITLDTSALTQLDGTLGCIVDGNVVSTDEGCATANNVGANAVVASRDGSFVYTLSSSEIDSFTVGGDGSLNRAASLPLPLRGGVDNPGSAGSVALSPDGQNLYVGNGQALAVLTLGPSGAVSQLAGAGGCVNEDGSGGCTQGPTWQSSTFYADWLAVSPDGNNVYAGTPGVNAALAVFHRASNGGLTILAGSAGCLVENGQGQSAGCGEFKNESSSAGMAFSPDGTRAYVTNSYDHELDVFTRSASGALTSSSCLINAGDQASPPTCGATARLLDDPQGLAVSGDNLYLANGLGNAHPGIAVFRGASSGALAQAFGADGCVSKSGTDGETQSGVCTQARAVGDVTQVLPSADGVSLYASGFQSDGISVFHRSTSGGALAQPAGATGCHAPSGNSLGCAGDRGMLSLAREPLALLPNGRYLYAVTDGSILVYARGRYLPLLPPVIHKWTDVTTITGEVLWKLGPFPRSLDVAVPAVASQNRFVPLTEAQRIPIGSELDTRAGTVKLVTASGTTRTYTGRISGGVFKVSQSGKRRDHGLTVLSLEDRIHARGACVAKASERGASARRVVQLLKSVVNGLFRTTGRYSDATAHAAEYTVADRCDGTLTTVRRGTVVVTDFRHRKKITLHAGASYLALAR